MCESIPQPRWHVLVGAVANLVSVLRRVADKLRRAMAIREAASQLRALSDYELKDMGVSRSEIDNKIRYPDKR